MVSSKRSLGSYYSPEPYARVLVKWALNGSAGRVLDPSFGGCAFLRVALEELGALGAPSPADLIYGADIDLGTAVWAAHLNSQGVPAANLRAMDFLETRADREFPRVEAVVGNPPYIRHHWITESSRKVANDAAGAAGVRLGGRSSLWAYFTVHAAQFVAPGGRFAFLLPGSALAADYSSEVLTFLGTKFGDVRLIRVGERVFADAQEETVVLLADRAGEASNEITVVDVDDFEALRDLLASYPKPGTSTRHLSGASPLGLKSAALEEDCVELFQRIADSALTCELGSVADLRIGTVTGANSFFVLNEDEFAALEMAGSSTPVVARSAWLTKPVFTPDDLQHLRDANKSTRLLTADPYATPSVTLTASIRRAEADRIHDRHHLQRTPWWSLRARVPDAFLPYMGGAYRGITRNLAGASSTNAVHQLDWRGPMNVAVTAAITASSWSTITSLSAELFGRHYGGGVLKLEIAAARKLIVLSPLVVADSPTSTETRETANSQADRMFTEILNLSRSDLELLEAGVAALRDRRLGTRSINEVGSRVSL